MFDKRVLGAYFTFILIALVISGGITTLLYGRLPTKEEALTVVGIVGFISLAVLLIVPLVLGLWSRKDDD